jgi:hypothetical protein
MFVVAIDPFKVCRTAVELMQDWLAAVEKVQTK